MRQLCFSAIFLSSCVIAVAQRNAVVKGVAFDSLNNQAVSSATITLMQRKDSSLVSFTMSDNSGRFEFTGIQNGDYRLLITHVNYHNSAQLFKVDDEHKNIDLGNIFMNDRSKVLSEVVVTSEAPPVTLVGDTIQYNAGSFKTQPNANVEDLLKKLPGVRVEKDGTVKAQGEKVQKVLVDGKEFFGNDPKIATKNLPADAVDKVQVYDKLSDQAQLTGFDDGNSEKTINLKLKKDKKKGMFGKMNAGVGTDERYAGKLNANSFKGARQMSAIGMGNNINEEGFSFMDVLNFTGALNQLKNGGGNININISPDDPLAGLLGGNNTGINTTFGGGVNYNNIIGTKTDFQSNYLYTRYNPNRISHVQRQYFSPANLYKQNSYVDNLNNNHRLNFNVDYQIDSFHSLKITPALNYQKTHNESLSDYMTWSDQGAIINDGNSYNLTNNEGYNLNTNLLFRKKFHKRGRTLSMNVLTNLSDNHGDGSLKSITDFFDQASGSRLTKDSINQNNNTASDLNGYNARAVYTEPVFKKSILEFSLGSSFTKSTSAKTTYDFNENSGKFDVINKALTNDYENTYGYTTGGLRLRKQTKVYNYAVGLSWQQSELEGTVTNQGKDSIITKTFRNFLPTARFQYYFSRFKNILINYSTNTNQPTISQLQPVPDNTNPLYIKVGNPRLKQEFIQTLRLTSSLVNPYKNRNLFVYLLLQQTQNKIVNYDKINSLGIDSVRPVNVNGVYNLNGNVSWGFPVRFLKGSLDISSTVSYYRGKQPVSDANNQIQMNQINTAAVGPEVRLNTSPTEKLDVSIGAGVNYSNSKYSIQSKQNSKYFNQEYSTDLNWQLGRGFFFATNFVYTITNQYSTAFNTRVPLWNASFSKQMLRYKRGEMKFSVHDLLDKNTRTSRSTSQNYIEDTRVNSLRRFFMLSFTYSLSKTGLSDAGSGGPRMIMR
jgi:outer membrane beta-barrel protein/carboxypeptidase family protein